MKKLITTIVGIMVAFCGYTQNSFPSSGNAGIGETSSASLTISNTAAYTDNELLRLKSGITWGGNTGHIALYNGVVENARIGWYMGDGNQEDGNLSFYTKEGNGSLIERLKIKHNGNIGIGVNNPDSKFHVGISNGAQFRIDYNNTGDNYYDANIHTFRGNGGFSEILTLNGTTNKIGIGTTTPTAALHIKGTGKEFFVQDNNMNTAVLGGWDGSSQYLKSINLGVSLTPLTVQASKVTFDGGL